MPTEIKIQVRFTEQTAIGSFSDALYFTEDEWASVDPKTVEEMKAARVANWMQAVQNPPPPYVPTKADLEAEKLELQARIDEVTAKIAVEDAKIAPEEPGGK